ncbi:tRNA (N(6)-L-threonylcarbamoyladenosine(37)-C(2))-methylthiotransferase MtaB [Bacteroidota bacterium]
MNKKKIAFKTFGCKLNYSETSTISNSFDTNCFEIVSTSEKADVYVINSCTVTAKAESKCKQEIRKLYKINPESTIVVVGCYSQLKADELAEMKEVSIVLGNDEKFNLQSYLEKQNSDETKIDTSEILNSETFTSSYSSGDRTRSFLKIQDGCDYFCSYCTIPFARGRSRSDNVENSIKKANEIANLGIKEIILSGINIGDFGKLTNETLLDFLKELIKVDGIERIRISSIEPDLLSDEIINLVHKSDKLLAHFHIPLQSGSNKVLSEMNRKYKKEIFANRVKKIKSLMPESCIAADVIVGFPGETDDNFMDTYNFIDSLEISYLHVFSYSDRENAKSSKLHNKIPNYLIKERSKTLQKLSDSKKQHFYRQNIGSESKVLFESENRNGEIRGWTENYLRVKTIFDKALINSIKTVVLKNLEAGVFITD